MTGRIFRSIFFVAGIILVACFVLLSAVLYGYFGAQLKDGMAAQAAYIARGTERGGLEYLSSLPREDARITWIAADGTVIFDNLADAKTMENHVSRAEVAQALAEGTGESSRYSATFSQKTFYYALRLADGTVLRVSDAQQTLWVLLLRMLQPVLCILAGALILSGVIAAQLSKRITAPLNDLDLEHPEECETYEELTPLLSRMHYQNLLLARQMREMQKQQREFSAITENMREGFLVVDQDANLLSHNSAALRILGAQAPAQAESVYALNRSAELRTAVSLALRGTPNEQPLPLGARHYRLIANPVEQGGAVLLLLDDTEKEERESMRREFTANVSHELKTPLTSISGAAEVIKDGLVRPADVPHFAATIYGETQRLIGLVNDIIELSRLDEQAREPEREDVDLYEIATNVCARLQDEAARKGVSIRLEGAPARVRGVRQILDEMLYNLLDNAIKYNKEGGSVCVAVEERDGNPVLRVADTGIGIPPECQSRVFERFYRVDKSHSKSIGGTGLGLSIVKHGAAFHNARVNLTSALDKGTTVEILF